MGNRSTDPWSDKLQPMCKSSEGWPDFIRVFPILDWSYHDVWTFLKALDLSYCSLYDVGFTSLGEKHNSRLNPKLKVDGEENFLPAYLLEDGNDERDSRC